MRRSSSSRPSAASRSSTSGSTRRPCAKASTRRKRRRWLTAKVSSGHGRTSSRNTRRTCSSRSWSTCRWGSTSQRCTSSTASRAIRSVSAALAAIAVALVVAASAGTTPVAGPPVSLAQPVASSSLASDRIYFVMTDRYANGDASNDSAGLTGSRNVTGYDPSSTGYWHGGDFKGLTGTCTDPVHGLARIKDLGFNAIWVTPVLVNQVSQGDSAGYHGYWGLDFTRVDPHLGSDGDFADFVGCAHSLGMK